MITKRGFVLRGSCFCEKYTNAGFLKISYLGWTWFHRYLVKRWFTVLGRVKLGLPCTVYIIQYTLYNIHYIHYTA